MCNCALIFDPPDLAISVPQFKTVLFRAIVSDSQRVLMKIWSDAAGEKSDALAIISDIFFYIKY